MSGYRPSLDGHTVTVGDDLPSLAIDLTHTRVVAGAIATRDFMPVHHDRDYAVSQGAPDIFMNILSDTAYSSRFVTDWAGPEARLRSLAVRLGVPACAGSTLVFTGSVTAVERDGEEAVLEVAFRAVNDLGEHLSGTASLTVPLE
jgi:acyl dehydratase